MMKKLSAILPIVTFLVSALFITGCSKKRPYTSASSHKATMRSYKVNGKRYYPTYVEVGQKMRGIASWYGPNFHGRYTSNGERYNMHARTAAHKTWPMGTMVKVKNLENGKTTIVRINDRGPFVEGRIIDCSYTAGKEIGLDKRGLAKVEIEVVGFSGKIHSAKSSTKSEDRETRVRLSNFGVQVGAFRRYEGAELYKRKYTALDKRYKPIVKRFDDVGGMPLYRVWIMGFASEEEAKDFKMMHGLFDAFIVRN
jgi:rare lipoprotein A